MRPEPAFGRRAALGLAALVLCTFLGVTTEILPVGLLPQMSRGLAVPEPVAGLLVTVYALLVAALAVPLTRLTVRLPRKPLLLATVAAYGVGNLGIALGPTFAAVAAGRAVAGVAHALFFSVSTAYVVGLVPRRLQGRALAVAASGASLGYVVGVPLATSIGAVLGWRAAFGSLAVGAALLLAVTWRLLPAIGGAAAPGRIDPAAWWRGGLVAVGAANVLGFTAHYLLYTYVSPLLIAAGVPEAAIGAALLLFGGTGLIGLWAAGLVIDRRPRAGFEAALALAAVAVGLLVLADGSPAGAIATTAAWVLAFGAMPAFFTTATIRTGVLTPDLSAAVNNSTSNIGIAAGAAAGGALYAGEGIHALVPVAALLFLLTLGAVAASRRGFPARP